MFILLIEVMKTLAVIFSSLLFLISNKISAQEFLKSNARVYTESGEIISSRSNEYALINLNSQTNQFSVDLCALLINPTKSDTIKETSQQLSLNFLGIFPIDDLEFYDLDGKEGKVNTITGELMINNIRKSYTQLNFILHRSNYPNTYISDIYSYTFHISFILEIDPVDFCLDYVLENCPKKIMLQVEDGIINKLNAGYPKVECEMAH
jgi:hypothetical protein